MKVPLLRHARIFAPLCLVAALGAAPDADPLKSGEKAAGEWIRTRLETARLDSEWLSERPLLESTVDGLRERAATLEEKRDHLTAKTAKDREDADAMRAKNKAAADDLGTAEARLKALVGKLAELRPMLPPRLSAALELPYRSLANPGLSVGERMQLTITVLNRCSQFNRSVTCGEEVLSIEGEQGAKSLQVIYWGLSHAYALDQATGRAWYGSPGPRGWQWDPRPDAGRPVARLIAVYTDKADPDFVAVPASLGRPMGEAPGK